MCNLLINFLSRQTIPLPVRICINLVKFTQSHGFRQSVKHAHNSSYNSKNSFSTTFFSSESKLIFTKYILNFPFNPYSKYPRCYLYCMCDEADPSG